MNRSLWITSTLVAVVGAALVPAAATASPSPAGAGAYCAPDRPAADFYAAGRVASVPVTVRDLACTTISVSHVRDVRAPNDRCQTFLLALEPPGGGDPAYTDPVEACGPHRTVLAHDVPNGTVFRVLYQVDYIDPQPQRVHFIVWS